MKKASDTKPLKCVFRTRYTRYHHSDGLHTNEPSKTRPDDHIPLKQLIVNSSNGMLSERNNDIKSYTNDTIIPVFDDPVDALHFREKLNLEKKELESKLVGLKEDDDKRLKDLKEKFKQKAKQDAKFKEWLETQDSTQTQS